MEIDLIIEIVTKQLHLLFQHVLQSSRGIDGQTGSTAKKAECAEHAYQSKTVVTMQVGNENGTDLGKP
jgi:hypothetical protein